MLGLTHDDRRTIRSQIGERGRVRLELALQRDSKDRLLVATRSPTRPPELTTRERIYALARDLPRTTQGAKTLVIFLYAAGSAYETELEGNIDS
jgi:hypothetical protein